MEGVVGPWVWGNVIRRGSGSRFARVGLKWSVFTGHWDVRRLGVIVGVLVLVARHDVEGNLVVASPLVSCVLESEVLQ